MRFRIAPVFVVASALSAAVPIACGGEAAPTESSEKSSDPAEPAKADADAPARPPIAKQPAKKQKTKHGGVRDQKFQRALVRLDEIADQVGELVEQGDVAGLSALWVEGTAFEDCHVADANLEPPQAAARRDELLAQFETAAAVQMAPARRGEVFFVNRWANKQPTGMGGRFMGDDCRVQYFARVNAVVRPAQAQNTTIEHRFDLLMVDGQWKLEDYLAVTSACEEDEGDSYGCARLREHLAETG